MLEVLPVPKAFSGIALEGDAAARVATSRCWRTYAALLSPNAWTSPSSSISGERKSQHDPPCRLPLAAEYTPEDGNLVKLFYVPALDDAVRYDRLTGYFNSGALALAARGIEGLVRSGGHMRLIVGCTLDPPEIAAIEKGEELRDMVEQHLAAVPLAPPNQTEHNALELLAWMIARGILDVRVAVPCDDHRRPIPADGIFHEKAGIIEDKCGDKIAWNGSLNETGAGWKDNWESINVYTSWGQDAEAGRGRGAQLRTHLGRQVLVHHHDGCPVGDEARSDALLASG